MKCDRLIRSLSRRHGGTEANIFPLALLGLLVVVYIGSGTPESSVSTSVDNAMSVPDKTIYKRKEPFDKVLPLPQYNALATVSLDNSLTRLDLAGNKIRFTRIAKDFVRYVSDGEFIFAQPVSDSQIAYAQSRVVILFDLARKEHRSYLICETFEESIVGFHHIGDGQYMILVQTFINDLGRARYTLKKYQIDFDHYEQVAELALERGQNPFVTRSGIFVYSPDSMNAYNLDLLPVEHPVTTFREYIRGPGSEALSKASIDDIVVHPTLPVAIIDLAGDKVLFRWEGDEAPLVFKLAWGDAGFFSLSPDNNWISYWVDDMSSASLLAVRFNPEAPSYFDPPIALGEFEEMPYSTAMTWMSAPLAYALIDEKNDRLIQWVFEP
jgi:hypothetical protein